MSNPTRYAEHQRRRELVGYLDLIDHECAEHAPLQLLLPIVRLCDLLLEHCGPGTVETAALRERIAETRLRLDHWTSPFAPTFATEDTGDFEVMP